MVRNFAKHSALDCAAQEQPDKMARIPNDSQMTTRRAMKSLYHSSILDSQTKGKFVVTKICIIGPYMHTNVTRKFASMGPSGLIFTSVKC